ncbi:hypothetical protein AB7M22_000499 [Pseudomonas sp. ADAK2 TE3594]
MGAGLARDGGSTFNMDVTESLLSRASPLPQVCGVTASFVFAEALCGSRACPRWRQYIHMDVTEKLLSRASPLPQVCGVTASFVFAEDSCGSEPARDGGSGFYNKLIG